MDSGRVGTDMVVVSLMCYMGWRYRVLPREGFPIALAGEEFFMIAPLG
jgi:hypothetical protein